MMKAGRSWHLQEYEGAVFSNHNSSLTFNDLVVNFQNQGPIRQDLNVVLSPEFGAFTDTHTLIFISNSGKAVQGYISLEGKMVCQLSNCIFCREFFFYIKCWPAYISHLFYQILTICALIILSILKWSCQVNLYEQLPLFLL